MWIDATGRALTVAVPNPWSALPDWLVDALEDAVDDLLESRGDA